MVNEWICGHMTSIVTIAEKFSKKKKNDNQQEAL